MIRVLLDAAKVQGMVMVIGIVFYLCIVLAAKMTKWYLWLFIHFVNSKLFIQYLTINLNIHLKKYVLVLLFVKILDYYNYI